MATLVFNDSAKNTYLNDTFVTTQVNPAYKAFTYGYASLRIKSSAGTVLYSGASPVFGTASNGASSLSGSITPSATGTAEILEFYDPGNSQAIATGACSVAGGGGAAILGSLSLVSGTPVSINCVFKIPLSNGATLRLNTALANSLCSLITKGTSSAYMGTGGTISFYDGTQPASANDAVPPGCNLLATKALASTPFSAAASGRVTLSASIAITPSATGTPTWARWTKGSYAMDFSVGVSGTPDATLANAAFTNGVANSITTFTITFP